MLPFFASKLVGTKTKRMREQSVPGMCFVDFREVRANVLSHLSMKPLAACGQILNE